MAVAIAKDVLAQIKARRYTPEQMIYVSGIDLPIDRTQQLQPILQEKGMKCDVCALGATFLSCVRLFNDFTVPAYFDDSVMRQKLGKFFSCAALKSIEREFECWRKSELAKVPQFIKLPPRKRLLFLMNEIVRQGGNFSANKALAQAKKLK